MYPTFFEFQGMGFHMWGLMLMLAFSAAILVTHNRAQKVGIDPDDLVPFYQIAVLAAIAGSRILHFVFAEPELFFSNPMVFFDPARGGFAFYGGAIFGTLFGSWYLRWKKIPILKFIDVATPTMMLGLCLGRLGCFFAGCCHGAAVTATQTGSLFSFQGGSVVTVDAFPWVALNFVDDVGVGSIHNVPIFPTQLWESTVGITLFLILSWMWKNKRRFDGQIFAALLMMYPFLRSTIEVFRGDKVRGTDWMGLFSTSQLVSIPVFALGLGIVLIYRKRGLSEETPFVYSEE